jgi:hypothetical protein
MTRQPAASIMVELPVGTSDVNVDAMHRAMQHGLPLVNGYSGHTPEHYSVIALCLQRGDPSILTYFARERQVVAVVHRQHDSDRGWRALVQRAGGVLLEETGVGPVYVIPKQPALHVAPTGSALAATPFMSGVQQATVDLGSSRVVRAVRIPLGRRYGEMPTRITIETSVDGSTWATASEGWTGEPALIAALEDPASVPMKIYLHDLAARYVRVSPVPKWVAEVLDVHGPG